MSNPIKYAEKTVLVEKKMLDKSVIGNNLMMTLHFSPLPNFGQFRFFVQEEKFWQSQFSQKFPCSGSFLFFFERDIFYFKLK